jgi:hypothetical protein
MGKGGEMNTGKGDESGGYENPNYPVVIGEDGIPHQRLPRRPAPVL